MSARIHPTAIVDPAAELGADVEIGPYCVITGRVTIGDGTRVMQHVSILDYTTIGSRCTIYPGSVIGGEPQDKKFQGEESWLHIGDDNVIREMVTINRGTELGGGVTRIGNRCLIMACCHVAHDCILGDDVTMANSVLLGGHVVVEDGAGIGGMVAIHHFVTVGRNAFLGGASRVSRDAPPFMIVEGNPARVRAINRVGLKRSGRSDETIAWLKEAQKLLFHDEVLREAALERLSPNGVVPADGKVLFEFLEASAEGKQGRARQP